MSDPAPLATTIRQVTLATRDLVYDPLRKVIYASVPSNAGAIGNSVTKIDPFAGAIGASVFVGSEPTKLAMSDNLQVLYVGLDGASAVRRVDLPAFAAGLQFGLGSDVNGPLIAGDMFVSVGSTDSLVMLRKNSQSGGGRGIAVYENGVPRATITTASTDFIEPSTNPSVLYGVACCYDALRFAISASGVTLTQTFADAFFTNSDIKSDSNLLYQLSGRVVNAETGAPVGTFNTVFNATAVLPDSVARRVYFITGSGSSTTIRVFDKDTFLPLGTIPVSSVSGFGLSLVRWGLNGLALRTDSSQVFLVESPLIGRPPAAGDFEADGRTDIAVWRPGDGNWYIRYSSLGAVNAVAFGMTGDEIVPADYDGDGMADVGVWRPGTGTWYVLESSTGTLRVRPLGVSSDIPVPRDYDGDGKADLAVYRPADGLWQIFQSSTNTLRGMLFGLSTDKPVPNDFDGDRTADIAVYRPSTGIWYVLRSSDFGFLAEQFGASTDIPVSADYDGDGKSDIAVYRPSTGIWYLRRSSDGGFRATQFGISTDIPVPGDYDGDGKADIAVFRDGIWYVLQSSNSVFFSVPFGQAGDVPVPFGYIR